jgi:ATP-dependent DNA helicase PIF1
LRVAYAVTIHKSQGMTLNKAVVELGDYDFTRGLTFVAISRVRRIRDIVFRSEIETERLQKLGGSTNLLKEDIIRRGRLNFIDAEDVEELEFLLN